MFKDISNLQLWQPFCLGAANHLCNQKEMPFKDSSSYLEVWTPFF